MASVDINDVVTDEDIEKAIEQIKLESRLVAGAETAAACPNAAEILAYRAKHRKENLKRSKDVKSYKPMERKSKNADKPLLDAPWLSPDWGKEEPSPPTPEDLPIEEPVVSPEPESEPELQPEPVPKEEPDPVKPKKVSIADRYLAAAATTKEEEDEGLIGTGYATMKKWAPSPAATKTKTKVDLEKTATADADLRPQEFLPLRRPNNSKSNFEDNFMHSFNNRDQAYPMSPFRSPVKKITLQRPVGAKRVDLKSDDFLPMRDKVKSPTLRTNSHPSPSTSLPAIPSDSNSHFTADDANNPPYIELLDDPLDD